MKYAICNELFEGWTFAETCRYARQCGYRGLEIAPFTLGSSLAQVSAAQRAELARTAAQHELEIIGLHWLLAKTTGYYLTSADPAVQQKTASYLGELAQLCHDLGGHIMVLGSPQQRNLVDGMSHAEGLEHAAHVLRQVVPQLEATQVTLAVEPLGPQEGNFLLTAAAGVELIERVQSPQVRLHLDVKAMSSEAIAIPELIRTYHSYMVHFHANDPNRRGPGMGELDFAPIMAALREVHYHGWVSVEVFDYSPGIEALAERSIQYLQGLERSTA